MSEQPFEEVDAWLLMALLYAKKPASLDLVRSAADSMGKAIISDTEMNEGLGRLELAKVIVKVPSGWTLSELAAGLSDNIDEQTRLRDDYRTEIGMQVVREFLSSLK